jgi:hypothetical protein
MTLSLLAYLMVAIAPDGGATGAPAPDELCVARLWLDAVRRHDRAGIVALSGYPLVIAGFNLDSGPDAAACGAKPRRDDVDGVRSFDPRGGIRLELADQRALEGATECLFKDNLFVDYIPTSCAGTWPSYGAPAVGKLGRVKEAGLAPRLRRYRSEVARLAKNHVLVQGRMTDNNGVTNVVLLALRADADKHRRVYAIFIDQRFEE